jgi:hypothetical protein
VYEIEIQIVEPESRQTRLESRLHALGPMIGVPQLCGNKDVLTRKPRSGQSSLQRLAHFTLVAVAFRAIEVTKSSFQRVSGCTYRGGCIGNQGAKAEYRHLAGSATERNSFRPKIRRFEHKTPFGSILASSNIPGYAAGIRLGS